MTLFRNKKNGLLYTIEKVTPPKYTGWWYEATPYKHATELHPHRKDLRHKRDCNLDDFTEVASS